MKKKLFSLLFHGIWSVALVFSCKSDEVNPTDKLLGSYWADTFPKDVVLPLSSQSVRLERTNDGKIKLTAFHFLYKTVLTPNGYENFFKDFEFKNCEIVEIDTTNLSNSWYPHFAKIINADNNAEMGKFRKWTYGSSGMKTNYYKLKIGFYTADSIGIGGEYYKWVD